MKKCLVYFRNSEYDMSAEELIIKFKESDKWQDFLNLHSNQKVIVPIDNANNFEYVLKQVNNPFNLVFMFSPDMECLNVVTKICKESGVPYFYDTIVKDWETLYQIMNEGVYSVYIGGDLGFDLPLIKKIYSSFDTSIRVIANSNIKDIYSFFIRPEDLDLYTPYIDVIEMRFPVDKPELRDSLFNIYFKQKKWNLDMSYLTFDEIKFPNKYMEEIFGVKRLNCHHRCMKGKQCDLCGVLVNFSNTLKEHKEELSNGSKRTEVEGSDNAEDT